VLGGYDARCDRSDTGREAPENGRADCGRRFRN
jgi:hypothetical protein